MAQAISRASTRSRTRPPSIIVRQSVSLWANEATLAPDPAMPQGLRGRAADNWRVLLSIADAYSEEWGERARSAALIMARGYRDEDIVVTLLRHIREIFEGHRVDRIAAPRWLGPCSISKMPPGPNGAASRMISSPES